MRTLKDIIASANSKERSVRSLGFECDKSDLFVQCQWQKEKDSISLIYVTYRILHAFFFLSVISWSIWDAARANTPDENHVARWPIYLTDWGFTLCTTQAVVSLALLLQHLVRKKTGSEKYNGDVTAKYKVYWALHTTAVVIAVGITGSYFVVEYNPARYTITALNLMMHAFNSVMMITDLLVVSHPFRLLHCYFPFLFATIYFCFNAIYFLAGGTGRGHQRYIYPALDWEKPGMTFLTVLGGLLYVLVAHFLLWLLVLGRNKLAAKYGFVEEQDAATNNEVQAA